MLRSKSARRSRCRSSACSTTAAYATLVSQAVAADEPITAESEAEKPTRGAPRRRRRPAKTAELDDPERDGRGRGAEEADESRGAEPEEDNRGSRRGLGRDGSSDGRPEEEDAQRLTRRPRPQEEDRCGTSGGRKRRGRTGGRGAARPAEASAEAPAPRSMFRTRTWASPRRLPTSLPRTARGHPAEEEDPQGDPGRAGPEEEDRQLPRTDDGCRRATGSNRATEAEKARRRGGKSLGLGIRAHVPVGRRRP